MSDFKPEWIWGDDAETTVFAQGYGNDRTIIFSFSLNPSKASTSLANRICAYMHGLEVNDESHSFADATAMSEAVWEAVRRFWPACSADPRAQRPDVVFAIDPDADETSRDETPWHAYQHPLFQRYVGYLADDKIGKTPVLPGNEQVDFDSLIRYEQLGGRGCATRVRRVGDSAETFSVFKGIDFRTFLAHTDDYGDMTIRHMIHGWHRLNRVLRDMPLHPNILPPPQKLVVLRGHGPDRQLDVVCGTLQPLYPGGDVASHIEKSNASGERIPLDVKARWCADMAAAVAHTHREAKTYHMDIRPDNFLIDEDNNLVLGDWEQKDAPAATIAPEADGTWDVEVEQVARHPGTGPGRPRLRYTKYDGPPRRNTDDGVLCGDHPWDAWNVFPSWSAQSPLALELAEVFSLGRTVWMLLRQADIDFDEIEHPSELKTDWVGAEDIPAAWADMTDRCMAKDPNERPDVMEVLDFWKAEKAKYQGTST